jgi:hypothetical protein
MEHAVGKDGLGLTRGGKALTVIDTPNRTWHFDLVPPPEDPGGAPADRNSEVDSDPRSPLAIDTSEAQVVLEGIDKVLETAANPIYWRQPEDTRSLVGRTALSGLDRPGNTYG